MLGGTEMPSCTPFLFRVQIIMALKTFLIRVFFTIVNSNRKNKPFKFKDVNNITDIRIESDHLDY